MLHVAFRRSDQAHARIRSIDCAAARAAPGVVAVLTAEDLSAAVRPLVATSRMPNYYPTPLLPLAQHKVRYVGEPVVGVIAQSRYLAEDAARAYRHRLSSRWLQSATRRRPRAPARRCCMKKPAPTCWSAASSSAATSTPRAQSAPVRVKGRFRMHRKTALAIEPRACLAEYEAGREALTLHSATQVPGIVRDALADGARYPRPSDPRGRAGCRRRLRRQGLALSGGNFRLRRGAAIAARGQMDQRPPGGPRGQQPGLR